MEILQLRGSISSEESLSSSCQHLVLCIISWLFCESVPASERERTEVVRTTNTVSQQVMLRSRLKWNPDSSVRGQCLLKDLNSITGVAEWDGIPCTWARWKLTLLHQLTVNLTLCTRNFGNLTALVQLQGSPQQK